MYEQVIIAEKPSVGKSIAQSLFQNNKMKDGYIECEGGKYAVTWAFGHLAELALPDAYDEKYKRWKMETLPIIPDKFKVTVNKNGKKQLGVIKRLGENAKEIVNACDSAREGELIAYYVLLKTGLYKKTVKRLWTSSVTEDGIRKAYKSLKDPAEYKNLLNSAIVRSQADWLIGINATRAFTVQVGGGEKVSIGRVRVPVVAMIYDRCKTIEEFTKKTYHVVESNFEQGETAYKGVLDQEPFESAEEAEAVVEKVKYEAGKVNSYETEPKKAYAPKLYNLTSLTNEANGKYGYSATEVLKIAQGLYEDKKCITYPRTSSSFVTKEEIPFMREVFNVLGESEEYKPIIEKADIKFIDEKNKKICDEKHVDDHHAILPTEKVPQNLDKKEKNIYDLIVKRFVSQCYPPAEYLRHVIKTEVKDYIFHTSFKELQKVGWKYVDGTKDEKEEEDIRLEPFSLNDKEAVRCVDAAGVEKETEPPKPYTEGKLVAAMETAGKELDDQASKEAMKDSGIGTPATRAATIEAIKKVGYVRVKGKSLYITEKGKALIEMLRKTEITSLTSIEYTGKWEERLNQIAKGEYDSKKFLAQAVKFTHLVVSEAGKQKVEVKSVEEKVVDCPKCQEGALVAKDIAFGCNRWKEGCGYRIWKKQHGRVLTAKQIKGLVEKGETETLTFTPQDKKKSKYKAKLVIKDEATGDTELEFMNKRTKEIFGDCPKCEDGKVRDMGEFFGCTNYPQCKFNCSKEIKSKLVTKEQFKKLFTEGKTEVMEGFVHKGKKFDAYLEIEDGTLKMRSK